MRASLLLIAAALVLPASSARPETPADFAAAFAEEARANEPHFSGLDAARGRTFFVDLHGGEWSCASCHTQDPRAEGRHAVTGKRIAPLAPSANPERFPRADKVEKWFRRNCNDVLRRACTAQEKGDVLAFLSSLGS